MDHADQHRPLAAYNALIAAFNGLAAPRVTRTVAAGFAIEGIADALQLAAAAANQAG
jgi:hypothetical protein